jgi:NAD(P)-dependent dehydrogenase (short-subunit alcohol dehydrogenase family)
MVAGNRRYRPIGPARSRGWCDCRPNATGLIATIFEGSNARKGKPLSGILRKLFDLSGRVAVVTGGSRGLGLQIATALGDQGAVLALVARKAAELDEAVKGLSAQGIVAHAFPADLSDAEGSAALVGRVLDEFGRIDILVNNAGATWGATAEDYPLAGWNKVIDLNLTGLFLLTQATAKAAFLPLGRGVVINLASTEGLQGHHPNRLGTIAYNAAKGGVINMTRALAAEWGPKGIRVNALAPGFFPSKMATVTLEAHGAEMVLQTPLGKLGGDQDLMGAALLLASDAGGHITGQVIVIDGGATII